jgi:glycosyltransferase involved in cell wall biosynthesis
MGVLAFRLPVLFEYRHHLWLRGLRKVIGEFRPDVVQIHQAFTLPVLQSALAKNRFGFELVIKSSMEKEVFYPQAPLRKLYYSLFTTLAAPFLRRRVDVFSAVGPGARDIVASVYKVPAESVVILPLGADRERFRHDPSARAATRRDLGISDDVVLIVYAGKLISNKDVHVAAQAVSQTETRAPMALLLVGNGSPDYMAKLRQIAERSDRRILFRPAVPNHELPSYFSAADIGVWPAESSNAAVEAALTGLPLVVSNIDATRHYVEAANGLTFQRGDVAALSNCLATLTDDPELRAQMGERGRIHCETRLSWDAIARRSIELYSRKDSVPDQP